MSRQRTDAKLTPNERTVARLARAHRRRVALLRILARPGPNGGGLCDECGVEHAHASLEVDHVNGIEWDRYKMSPQMRYAKYWREHEAGVQLRALCQPCNARTGQRFRKRRRA